MMKGGRSKGDSKNDTKLSVKRKGDKTVREPAKRGKAGKDPNKPKRPPSAFFVFMEEFRKSYKEKNPKEKRVAVIGKAGGDKWKTMSEGEKGPYVAKANKRKAEYEKSMAAYNKKQSEGGKSGHKEVEVGEESDRSKSEVNDEEEEEASGEEEEGDDE